MALDERELDRADRAEPLEGRGLVHRQVVDPELQALLGLRRVVGVAGLEVGDPGAARRERTDPVDHADDRHAVELELEELLDRQGLALAVVEPPVPEHPLLDEPPVGHRDRPGGELLIAPAFRDGAQDRLLRLLELTLLALLDQAVHELADPCLVAGRAAEPELVAEHVLQLAVLERGQPGVAEAEILVERSPRLGPIALEPPGGGPQRMEPVERGQSAPVLRGGIGELASPEGRRLAGRDRLVERRPGCRPPGCTQLAREPCALGQLVSVGVGVRAHEHDPPACPADDHVEEAAFVLQPGADRFGARRRPLERRKIEHGLGTAERREVALGGARHDHRVELQTDGPVRGEDGDGIGTHTVPRRPSRSVLPGVQGLEEPLHAGVAALAGLGDRVGERDDGVEVAPIVGVFQACALDEPA